MTHHLSRKEYRALELFSVIIHIIAVSIALGMMVVAVVQHAKYYVYFKVVPEPNMGVTTVLVYTMLSSIIAMLPPLLFLLIFFVYPRYLSRKRRRSEAGSSQEEEAVGVSTEAVLSHPSDTSLPPPPPLPQLSAEEVVSFVELQHPGMIPFERLVSDDGAGPQKDTSDALSPCSATASPRSAPMPRFRSTSTAVESLEHEGRGDGAANSQSCHVSSIDNALQDPTVHPHHAEYVRAGEGFLNLAVSENQTSHATTNNPFLSGSANPITTTATADDAAPCGAALLPSSAAVRNHSVDLDASLGSTAALSQTIPGHAAPLAEEYTVPKADPAGGSPAIPAAACMTADYHDHGIGRIRSFFATLKRRYHSSSMGLPNAAEKRFAASVVLERELLTDPVFHCLLSMYYLVSVIAIVLCFFFGVLWLIHNALQTLDVSITMGEGWDHMFIYGEVNDQINRQLCHLQQSSRCSGGSSLCNASSYESAVEAYGNYCPFCVQQATIATFTTTCADKFNPGIIYTTAFLVLLGVEVVLQLAILFVLAFGCSHGALPYVVYRGRRNYFSPNSTMNTTVDGSGGGYLDSRIKGKETRESAVDRNTVHSTLPVPSERQPKQERCRGDTAPPVSFTDQSIGSPNGLLLSTSLPRRRTCSTTTVDGVDSFSSSASS